MPGYCQKRLYRRNSCRPVLAWNYWLPVLAEIWDFEKRQHSCDSQWHRALPGGHLFDLLLRIRSTEDCDHASNLADLRAERLHAGLRQNLLSGARYRHCSLGVDVPDVEYSEFRSSVGGSEGRDSNEKHGEFASAPLRGESVGLSSMVLLRYPDERFLYQDAQLRGNNSGIVPTFSLRNLSQKLRQGSVNYEKKQKKLKTNKNYITSFLVS